MSSSEVSERVSLEVSVKTVRIEDIGAFVGLIYKDRLNETDLWVEIRGTEVAETVKGAGGRLHYRVDVTAPLDKAADLLGALTIPMSDWKHDHRPHELE